MRILLSKLLPYRSFARFTLLQVGGTFLLLYVAANLGGVSIQGSALPLAQWFTFPTMWGLASALAHWLFYIPGFFVVQIVCADFELKMLRAQIIAGLERRHIIYGWVGQNLLLAGIGTAAAFGSACLLGHKGNDGWGLGAGVMAAAGFALYGCVFLNYTLLAAVVTRRPMPALTALVLWPLVVEPLCGVVLDRFGLSQLQACLPFASAGTLTPLPGLAPPLDLLSLTTLAAAACGLVAVLLAWAIVERLDL